MNNVRLGRGGAGNVRSPSRDPVERRRQETAENESLEKEDYLQRQEVQSSVHATGRGGHGNIPIAAAAADERGRGRGRDRSEERAGGVGSVLRSLSRSRSRDARSSPSRRAPSVTRQPHMLNRVEEFTQDEDANARAVD